MSSALLATKLYMPPVRRGSVMRPRLINTLNEGLTRKLTLVSAPAGSGKTTLLSEWIRHDSIPAAWLSLDDNDNDVARFLMYMIAALQMIEPSVGETALATLQFPQLPPLDTILTPVINEIVALQDQIVLVLDDYHLIDAQPVHEALIFLLDHLPSQLHLMIATRTDPPLPLARLRTRALMTEIRADDLRFNQEEIDAFLNETGGFTLSAEEVAALEARTEGWIAGLQLAALSMQGRDDISSFIDAFTGTHRYILDYLTEEVLIRQSENIQDFLLQTSILERLSGPLCDAVTGQSDGQATLERLEQANLFIVPLDDERNWYRYHHLFADMLLRHLRKLHPEQVPTLHNRASAWYEENDYLAEAIDHCLAAEDWEQSARLVGQSMSEMMARGEFFTTMLARAEALPDEIIRANPFLGVSYAWVLSITLQLDDAEHRLQEMERIAGDELPDGIRLQMTVVRAAFARQRHDIAGAFELLSQVEQALPDNPMEDDPLQRTARIGVAFNYADAYRFLQGHMALAQAHYTEALTLAQQAGSTTLILAALSGIAQAQIWRARLHEAAETCRQGLEIAREAALQNNHIIPAAAYVRLAQTRLFREWNQLDEAATSLAESSALIQRWQIGDVLCESLIAHAWLKQARGDLIGALNSIEQAAHLAPVYQTIPRYGGPVAACRARLMLAQAQAMAHANTPNFVDAAQKWAETRGLTVDASITSMNDEYEYVVFARLLIAQNEIDRALRLLDHMLQTAEGGERTARVIEIHMLQALAYQALGDIERALDVLEEAFSLAEPQGYVRLFIDEGAPMLTLLRQAGRQGICIGYVNQLLSTAATEAIEAETSPLVDPLSERELEILQLIALGYSNTEIAQELVVAIGTVKSHTGNIYSKLGVRSRTKAVARARDLDLL